MRLIIAILLIAFFAWILGIFLPWWSIALASFPVTLLFLRHPGAGFIAGFAGIFLLWTAVALWLDIANNSVLSSRVASLLPLGGSVLLLIVLTAFTGGLVGGLAGLAGSAARPGRRFSGKRRLKQHKQALAA